MEEYLPYLKPFLELLGTLPDVVTGIGKDDKKVDTREIIADTQINFILSKL
jgi:hypothetical protein